MNATTSPTTAKPAFREAVKYALDYRGLVKLAGYPAVPMAGIVPTGLPGALPAKEAPKQNLQRARAALARAGISNPTVKLLYIDFTFGGIAFSSIAQKIRSDLGQVGINVELNPTTFANFVAQQFAGKYEMSLRPNSPGYNDPEFYVRAFAPGGEFALRNGFTADMASAALKTAYRKATSEVSPTKRLALIQDYQRRLNAASNPYSYAFATPYSLIVASSGLANVRPIASEWKLDIAELKAAG
jgi:peptide/nickel transport system substrate-binding protein